MFILWLQFIFCSTVIVLSGYMLSKYGDIIAEKTGLGKAWIGLVLMSSVTSLPELITGISSVTIAGVPNIALGDIMGSCVFNLSIIAIIDIFHGPKPIFLKVEHGHILSAGFGVIMICLASISILSNNAIPGIGHIGLYTPIIILIYAIGMRSIFYFEKRKISEFVEEKVAQYEHITTKEAVFKYVLNAIVIIGAASWLPFLGAKVAEKTGLGQSFIGSIFIAITTSLPELAVSISAFKIGATDMAIANLFGSNMFNIFIIAIDDIFYTKGPILSFVSASHAITGFMAVLMTGIAIVSLTYRLKKKAFLRLGWDAISILMAYAVNIYLLYSMRGKG